MSKLGSEIKTEYEKFATYLRTLELRIFKGKVHQKVLAPNPGQEPTHAWLPLEEHDTEAPAPGEPLVTGTSTSTTTSTGTEPPPGGLYPPTGASYPVSGTATGTGTASVPTLTDQVRYGDDGPVTSGTSEQPPAPILGNVTPTTTPAAAVPPGSPAAAGSASPEPLIARTANTPAAPGYPPQTAGPGTSTTVSAI